MTTHPWNDRLLEQIGFHWTHALRPRLDGLTDEEYLWEPVPSWSIRRRGTGSAATPPSAVDVIFEFRISIFTLAAPLITRCLTHSKIEILNSKIP